MLAKQIECIGGPLDRKQKDAASTKVIREKWLSMAPGHQLADDKEIYPLDDCAKGEEMKRIYFNRELRHLDDDENSWPIATSADLPLADSHLQRLLAQPEREDQDLGRIPSGLQMNPSLYERGCNAADHHLQPRPRPAHLLHAAFRDDCGRTHGLLRFGFMTGRNHGKPAGKPSKL